MKNALRKLDIGATEYVHRQLIEQRDQGRAVLLISGELEEIISLSDRIAVMYEGEIMGIVDGKNASLQELGLWWCYEFPVFIYDDKKRPRVWTPDFYIPKLGMYVEVCGAKRQDYQFREKIYKENGYRVIFLHLYLVLKNI